jgi:uncharacterized repeat protein (TIGR03847 family)
MPRVVHLFDPPERFVAGTVGMPGERTFYLQARAGARIVSVALEKGQVALLADRVNELLDRVGDDDDHLEPDEGPLESPVTEEFRVGVLALGYDEEREVVLIEAQAVGEEVLIEAGEVEGPDLLRVLLTPAQARSFAARALAVVAAGRPPCPFCSLPLDPSGHICPRANGYRR